MFSSFKNKLSEYINFIVPNQEISYITYQQIRLYYPKFKDQTFKGLYDQYLKFTGKVLLFSIAGLIAYPNTKIEDIIKTKPEEQLFQKIVNNHSQDTVVQSKYKHEFNRLIYRLMKSKLQYSGQPLQFSKMNDPIEFAGAKEMLKSVQWQDCSKSKCNQFIFWIDDEPYNNVNTIKIYFLNKNIEVVQITSTKQMIEFIEESFDTLQQQKKIVFISDMTRKQGEHMNYQAGVDLFQYIYKNKKMNNKGILFVGDLKGAKQKIKNRELQHDQLLVINDQKELIKQVYKQFALGKKGQSK